MYLESRLSTIIERNLYQAFITSRYIFFLHKFIRLANNTQENPLNHHKQIKKKGNQVYFPTSQYSSYKSQKF